MPRMRVCAEPDCPTLGTTTRCTHHTRVVDKARGTRQQRGYDAAYDEARRKWKPQVEAGLIDCHAPTCLMPIRRILLGAPWDLGHDDDRRIIRGPEHRRCNRAAGGKAAHH